MKTKIYAIVIFFLLLGLFASGCGAGQLFGPTLTPTATATLTPTITPTPYPAEITQKGATMLLIPAGSFMMGGDVYAAEKPAHSVTLSSFYMDQYEVSNALYKACVDANGCTAPAYGGSFTYRDYYGNPDFDRFPVISVSWNQAKTYCIWRGSSTRLHQPEHSTKLPTEAEWEYAARGTDGRTYPWGEVLDPSRANYQSDGDTWYTTAIDSYPAGKSPFGLYNMAGNVWEWVNDWYDSDYYQRSPLSDPQGPSTGQYRVVRGGGWGSFGLIVGRDAYDLRSATRSFLIPDSWENVVGFRCAYTP
ncbi:MAG: SUMF1/EgtB/PvdO family nonheme iron enzyme [Anaerolineales bacterium]